jgi:hypothetical protein
MTNPVPRAATQPSLASGSALSYRRISPTDISQFIRLEQCQRYLALRLKERVEGRRFMYDYGVAPQSIPPLLTRAGASFEQQAPSLAHALAEFVTIEHHVELGQWKATRNLAPDRRVLLGETLLAHYCEADQSLEVVVQNRENIRRKQLYERYKAEHEATHPGQKFTQTKAQREETKWSQEGLRVKLRLETAGVDCSLDEALALSNRREGDRVIVFSR